MKKISIITIANNNLSGLKKTVDSVCSQTAFDQLEYIIIDGDSTDGTKDYLNTLPNSISWTSESDRGISHAFNKGIKKSTGEMILCLNSGDVFSGADVIEKVIEDFKSFNVDIISYKVKVTDRVYIPSINEEEEIYIECEEPHQGTFVKRNVYEEIGGYSEEYKIRMDYHFFARCKKNKCTFKYVNRIISEYEPGGISMVKENRHRFWREGMSIKFLYEIPFSWKDFIKWIYY